jgi:ribonuclease R
MAREGEGFLKTATNQMISLSAPSLRGFYDGDEVEAQISQIDIDGNTYGRVIALVNGVVPLVIGRMQKAEQGFKLIPFDRKFTRTINIPQEMAHHAKAGDIVQVRILRDVKHQSYEAIAQVLNILGDFATPGIEIKMAMYKFNLAEEWPAALQKEAEKVAKQPIKATGARKDLTALNLVTIDGEDAKDFDDAVYCEKKLLGGFRLWVAIADVSFYVKPGSALDKEALERGNSTYFPGFVIPMLPEVLSNELCSLKPNVPRFCVVCQMSFNGKGELKRSKFYRALMHSKARLTYTEVAEIVAGNTLLRKQHAPLLSSLDALHDLYHVLHKQRRKRGAIDFETQETRILFDRGGKINSIVPQKRNVAHKMIEESMLAANVCAAKFIEKHKKNALFRIHDRPPGDKLTSLRQFLAELGLDLPGKYEPTSKDFTNLIERIQNRPDKHLIETVLLRSLSQAQYSPNNIGHFGLAYTSYVHFTSPIRRYPDLLVHRTICQILEDKRGTSKLEWDKLGAHCSETERRSDDATRDATFALKCHYMQDKVGERYRGIITGVANFGIFVELKEIYVEGLVHVTALGDEYFHYDAGNHRMIGDRTRTVYRLGDEVTVIVARVDLEAKKIDLELVTKRESRKDLPKKSSKKINKKAEKRPPRPRKPRAKR